MENISNRLGIAILCGFWAYLLLLVFPSMNINLDFIELGLLGGRTWLVITAIQVLGLLLNFTNEPIKNGEI